MGDIFGYAVPIRDRSCTGQRLRLEKVSALRVFENVRSGQSWERLGLRELLGAVDLFKGHGVDLLSQEKGIDSGLAGGEWVFYMFSAIAHFERRVAHATGKRSGSLRLGHEKAATALELVRAGLSPTTAARQAGLRRATVYCEMAHASVRRPA